MSLKIFLKICCGLDVRKIWIYACIGITVTNGRTDCKQARFSSFSKGLQDLSNWLVKYNCILFVWDLSARTGSLFSIS